MWRSTFLVVVGAALVGCGGGDRDQMVRDANTSCMNYETAFAAPEAEEDPQFWPRTLERHIGELKDIDPPSEDSDAYEEMLDLHEASLAAVEEWADRMEAEDFEAAAAANDRWRASAVKAAEIAADLGLEECSTALS